MTPILTSILMAVSALMGMSLGFVLGRTARPKSALPTKVTPDPVHSQSEEGPTNTPETTVAPCVDLDPTILSRGTDDTQKYYSARQGSATLPPRQGYRPDRGNIYSEDNAGQPQLNSESSANDQLLSWEAIEDRKSVV